jgi:hypothetical protein
VVGAQQHATYVHRKTDAYSLSVHGDVIIITFIAGVFYGTAGFAPKVNIREI